MCALAHLDLVFYVIFECRMQVIYLCLSVKVLWVIVVACAVQAGVEAAGIKLAGVPQTKPLHRFSQNFQDMFSAR